MKAVDQLYQRLRRRIELEESGWREGQTIATEVTVARAEGVSRTTLRNALKRLSVDGLLVATGGKRRKVCRPKPVVPHADRQPIGKELGRLAKTLQASGVESLEHLCKRCPALQEQIFVGENVTSSWGESLQRFGLSPSDISLHSPKPVRCYEIASDPRFDVAEVCKSLNIASDAEIYWLLRLRFARDSPLALQWCIVRFRPFNELPILITTDDLKPGGLTQAYDRFGIRRAFATVSFRATRASAEDAHLLQIDTEAPLLEEHRVSYTMRGVAHAAQLWPYEYLFTLYTDRVRLHSAWSEIMEDDPSIPVLRKSRRTTKRKAPR